MGHECGTVWGSEAESLKRWPYPNWSDGACAERAAPPKSDAILRAEWSVHDVGRLHLCDSAWLPTITVA